LINARSHQATHASLVAKIVHRQQQRDSRSVLFIDTSCITELHRTALQALLQQAIEATKIAPRTG
jgi:hypothetical protein